MSQGLLLESAELNNSGESIQFFDLQPNTSKVKGPPIYLELGWMTVFDSLEEFAQILKEFGRRVIGVNAPHGIDPDQECNEGYTEIEQRKGAAIRWLRRTKRIKIMDVVAHSQGSLTATATIEQASHGQYRNLLLFNPAGFIGADKTSALLARCGHDAFIQLQQLLSHPMRYIQLHALSAGAIASNIPRAWRAVEAIANANITRRLQRIRHKLHGVKIIATEGDNTFPLVRMREQANLLDPHVLREEPGMHNEMLFYPGHFARITVDILNELESRTAA